MRIALKALFALAVFCLLAQCYGQRNNDVGSHEPHADLVRGTLGALETEGLLKVDEVDTSKTWTRQLAFQKLSKRRSRQIYLVMFSLRNGESVNAIAVQDESPIPEESGLVVYVLSRILQPDGKPVPPRR